MIGEELAAELEAAARRYSAAVAASGDAWVESKRAERELEEARHAWEQLTVRLCGELVKPELGDDADATECGHRLVLDADGRQVCPVCELGEDEAEPFKLPRCGSCGRERRLEDGGDYHPAQVLMGQQLGWYSGDDGELCPDCMTKTLRGQR